MASPAPPAPTVIALEGPSGAGKSTLSKALAESLDAVWMDEAYYRLSPRPSLEVGDSDRLLRVETRLLLEEGRRFREANVLRNKGRSVVADTGFVGPITYTFGLVYLGLAEPAVFHRLARTAKELAEKGSWGLPERSFYLTATSTLTGARAARSPQKHPAHLRKRHGAVAAIERRLWLGPIHLALPGRVDAIRASAPIPKLVAQTERKLREAPAQPLPSAADTTRLIGLLGLGVA